MLGTVKWFDATKGFGFITPNNGGVDAFVHISAVRAARLETLAQGDRVAFDWASERGRNAATNLELLK